jgi:transcriptional regulator with XRE-family HTH domain
MRFGDMLKEARDKAGLSQNEVARALGIPVTSYRNWERERREPPLPTVLDLAELFKAPAKDLLLSLAELARERKRAKAGKRRGKGKGNKGGEE